MWRFVSDNQKNLPNSEYQQCSLHGEREGRRDWVGMERGGYEDVLVRGGVFLCGYFRSPFIRSICFSRERTAQRSCFRPFSGHELLNETSIDWTGG